MYDWAILQMYDAINVMINLIKVVLQIFYHSKPHVLFHYFLIYFMNFLLQQVMYLNLLKLIFVYLFSQKLNTNLDWKFHLLKMSMGLLCHHMYFLSNGYSQQVMIIEHNYYFNRNIKHFSLSSSSQIQHCIMVSIHLHLQAYEHH